MPSSIRLLRMFNHQDNKEKNDTASPLDELDESDVVWSSSAINSGSTAFESHPPTPLSTSSSASPSQFNSGAGISAAIASGDRGSSPVVQRKKTAIISPLISEGDAAAIPTVVAPPAPSTSPLARSAPVKVPIWTDSLWIRRGGANPTAAMGRFDEEEEEEEEGFDDEEEEMVPPHEMVARSQRTTTFSVVEGAGRTLKGRDLSTVRHAVMQRTGFLD